MKKITYAAALLMLISLYGRAQSSPTNKIIFSKFVAFEKEGRLIIDWSTDGNSKTNYWEVQCSKDGKRFSTMALVMGPDPSKTGDDYEYKDKLTIKNTAEFYRVVHIIKTGEKQLSEMIKRIKLEQTSFVNPAIKSKEPATY